jgi:hypothetical protein
VTFISLSAAVLAPWLDSFSKLSVMTNPDPTTPSKSLDPQLPSSVLETPSYIRQVASGSYSGGTLEDARRAVLDDLGLWIPQVPVDFMMDHILPPVNCDFNAVKTKLVDSGRILGGRWAAFDKDPIKSAAHENNVFKPLEGVFADIVHQAGGYIRNDNGGSGSEAGEGAGIGGSSGGEAREVAGSGGSNGGEAREVAGGGGGGSGGEAGRSSNHRTSPLLTYHNNPDQAPYSERHSSACPDGYFVWPSTSVHVKCHGKSKATVHNWDDITVVEEFKKNNKPAAVTDVSFSLMDKS